MKIVKNTWYELSGLNLNVEDKTAFNMVNSLDDIAKKHGTDKSSLIHNYCVKYEKYFPFKREEKLKIIEIGVYDGQSLKMWKDFYYNSTVIGIDIMEKCKKYEEENIFVEIGSQVDENFIFKVCEKYQSFDLILDDGSHINEHVIKSYELLFPYLKSGGVYVVEDSCTSYWNEFNGGIHKPNTSVEYFKNLIDDVNFRGVKNKYFHNVNSRREDVLMELNPAHRTDIESINFLNSLIIITKR